MIMKLNNIERHTWSYARGKANLGVGGKVSLGHVKCIQSASDQKTISSTSIPKEVNLEIIVAAYIPPPNKTISMVWYIFILDMNGLLCTTQHVLSQHKWGPFVHLVPCGNKMVCP
jgi:hypothetical protein